LQPLRWINVSRHSPSFGVKMNCNEKTYETMEIMGKAPSFTNFYEPPSTSYDCNEAVTAAASYIQDKLPLTNTRRCYIEMQSGHRLEILARNGVVPKPIAQISSIEQAIANAPAPIYLRPNELCFDDVADSGEILSEFFMPSSFTMQPVKSIMEPAIPPATAAQISSAEPPTFTQLYNFYEHYDHKDACSTYGNENQISKCETDIKTCRLFFNYCT
uniref:ShKT domain-containing protein n=1 Tax=Gongylonema pulchrum TaxID=637853 RepID=A0A183EQF8_9BILA